MGIAGYRFQTIIAAEASAFGVAADEVCTFAGSDTIGGPMEETVYERVQRETSSIRKINARDLKHGNTRTKFQGSFNGPK